MSAEGASPTRIGPEPKAAAAVVLADLEGKGVTARVRFETDVGEAEVDLVGGKIVDAYMGDLLGRSALLALLGVSEGRFQVIEMALQDRPALVPSIDAVIKERDRRVAAWRALSEKSPPLSSVLRVTPAGNAALKDGGGDRAALRLLRLLDGRRTITDVIDESGLDAVEGLRDIVALVDRGLATKGSQQPSLFPLAPVVEKPSVLTALLDPSIEISHPPTEAGVALRKRTVIGLGIPTPDRPPPRRAEVQRIINVTTPPPPPLLTPSGPPVAVPPRQRGRGRDDGPASGPPSEAGVHSGPRFVGRYEVLGRIGYGGMGSVYLCRLNSQGGFRRLFALKILRQHLVQDQAAAEKFLEEARLAGHMHHPNVVSVVDAGFEGPQPYLVMDYVEGASLKQLLSADPGRRPPELILPVLLDALAGLQAAHTLTGEDGTPLNIVHCDVSPENLLVGVDGVCRLTDFGVAKKGISTQRDEVAHGKPAYMAPEQFLRGRVDRRADIFAVGVMLYSSLTGEKLFEAPTAEETVQRVCNLPIVPPSTVGLRPPPCLDFVCMKSLERDPDRRFSTADEMLTELRRVAQRENLLGPASLVADWVRQSVGPELAQRRLSVLDVTRAGRGAPEVSRGSTDRVSFQAGPMGSEPPLPNPNASSQTVSLATTTWRVPRWATIGVAVFALGVVLITLLWPGLVSRAFRVKTGRVVAKDLDLPAVPSALPRGTAPAADSVQSSSAPRAPAPPVP